MSLVVYYSSEEYEHMCFSCALWRESQYGEMIETYATDYHYPCEACKDRAKEEKSESTKYEDILSTGMDEEFYKD